MADIQDYAYLAANFCRNVPRFTFERAFVNAARVYFKQTHAWQSTIKLSVKAGKAEYAIDTLEDDAEIESIISVADDTRYLPANNFIPVVTRSEKPTSHYARSKRSIGLNPVPKEDATYTVVIASKPILEAKVIEDEVFNDNAEGLIHGAVMQLKMMGGTTWHDPQMAAYYENEFEKCITEKRIELMHGQNNAELHIQYPNFI